MAQQPNHYPSFLLDALYCSEDHWEEKEEEREDYFLKEENNPKFPVLLEQDLYWDNEELDRLLSKEQANEQLHKTLQTDQSLCGARRDAVQWMLKVNAHYSFSTLTAVLAVDYLDRFLSKFHPQKHKPWLTQLSAVACFSLAAKVEETHVPLLIDLQVEETKYLFEAKTIKRMEILVLSTLQWRMNPVTPLSFLDYTTRRLGLKHYLCWEFLRRCEQTLLSVISDSRFPSYQPSVVATATMLHIVNSIEPCIGLQYEKQLIGIIGIKKEIIDDCYRFISETSENHGRGFNKRKFGTVPGSPNGIMDLLLSSDSSNESWSVASSVSSSPEPLSKKSRAHDQLLIIPR